MRTYSEEKRSGTIELLLTSPVTDFQIIMGKFLGCGRAYALMLAVTLIHIAVLFIYGNPEWKPIASGYLGLLLMGASFISVGLLISSLTRNQIVAGMVTFAVLPAALDHHVGRRLGRADDAEGADGAFDHRSFRRFLQRASSRCGTWSIT